MTSRVDSPAAPTASTRPDPVLVEPTTWRGRALVPVLVYVGLLVAVISSVGAPLVPTLATDYGIQLGTAQWSLTIALLIGAVFAPVIGRLSDGPRRLHLLIAALGVMTTGSVLAAIPSDTFALLLLGRGMQGVGLSLLPLVMGVARDHLSPERARSTLATLSVTAVVGVGLGYPLTGVIAEHLDYRYAFWLAGLLGLVALVLAALVVPKSHHHPPAPFDLLGAVLLGLGLGGLLLAVSMGENWGWGSARVLALAVGSVVVLALWTWQQLRARIPLVDLRLMRQPTVATANVAAILAGVGMYMLMSMIIRYVQTPESTGYGLGASVLVASLVLLPMSAGSYFSSKLATALTRRMSPALVVCVGMLAFVAALSFFAADRRHLWEVLVVMGLAGVGIGCSFSVMPRMIVSVVAADQTGGALALNQVLRQVGYSVGSALSATVLTAHTVGASPFPTEDGYVVCAWIAIAMCVLTAVVTLGVQARSRTTAARRASLPDDELAVVESVDSGIAGVVGYEPEEARPSRGRNER